MTHSYPYKPKVRTGILATLFFTACVPVLWWRAQGGTDSMTVLWVIDLGPMGTDIFNYALFGVAVLFVLAGLFVVYLGIRSDACLTITPSVITIPARSGADTSVPLSMVQSVKEFTVQRQRMLRIRYAGSREATIMASMLPRRADYDNIKAQIEQSLRNRHIQG